MNEKFRISEPRYNLHKCGAKTAMHVSCIKSTLYLNSGVDRASKQVPKLKKWVPTRTNLDIKYWNWIATQTGNSYISTWQKTNAIGDVSSGCLTSRPDFKKRFRLLKTGLHISTETSDKKIQHKHIGHIFDRKEPETVKSLTTKWWKTCATLCMHSKVKVISNRSNDNKLHITLP